MKIIRFILMVLWFFGSTFFLFLVSLFRPFRHENGTLFCRLVTPFAIRIMGLEVILRDSERMRENRPCIFLINHQATIDLFIFGYVLPDRTITIGKKSIRLIPMFGWLYWLSGHLLIDRSNNFRAMETMKKARERIHGEKLSVFIAPEGTRSRGKGLGPFKKGAFHLAVETGLPLVPIVASSIHGVIDFWKWNPGTVIVQVMEPIPVEGRKVEELLKIAHDGMQTTLESLDAEIARKAIDNVVRISSPL